jgi:hypothetical protein
MLQIAKVDLDKRDAFDWVIDVPNEKANIDNKFVLRFAPHRNPPHYIPGELESSSRGFYLYAAAVSSSSSASTSTATATSASSSTSTSTSTSLPANGGDNNNSGGSKTNVGAIVGGVIGGLAFIVLCVIAGLLWRRERRKKQGLNHTPVPQTPHYEVQATEQAYGAGYGAPVGEYYKHTVPQTAAPATELGDTSAPVELDNDAGRRHY